MMLEVEARGMATKLAAVATGADRKTITVSDGAVVRGRLVNHGKPVAGAELGVIARERGGFGASLKVIGNPYEEIRIGTQPDGTFVITNVPAAVDWYVYGKMESIASLGATQPVGFSTKRDNEEVNVGDIEIQPGHRMGGKVTLSDGAAMAEGMRITLGAKDVWDNQTVMIGRDGRFEFAGVPAGKIEVFPPCGVTTCRRTRTRSMLPLTGIGTTSRSCSIRMRVGSGRNSERPQVMAM